VSLPPHPLSITKRPERKLSHPDARNRALNVLLLEEFVANEGPGAGVVAEYELTGRDLLGPDPGAGDRRDFPVAALERGCVVNPVAERGSPSRIWKFSWATSSTSSLLSAPPYR
jgi:hypothetical protein